MNCLKPGDWVYWSFGMMGKHHGEIIAIIKPNESLFKHPIARKIKKQLYHLQNVSKYERFLVAGIGIRSAGYHCPVSSQVRYLPPKAVVLFQKEESVA